MISTLLFDFNNVLLFVEESAIVQVTAAYEKVSVPNSRSQYFYLNTELLQFIKEEKKELATGVLTASEFSLYQPEIKTAVTPYFDHIFYAKDRAWAKDLPATYLAAAAELKVDPASIFFTDDKIDNVEAAARAGLTTHHYTTNAALFADLAA